MAATGIPVNQAYSPASDPQKPAVYHPPPPTGQGQWSTGLCECFSDVPNCCLTCWCPCITFGRIAEIVDRGQSSCGTNGALYALLMALTGGQCIYSCTYRSKMKIQYGMEASGCADCCLHCWCETCALCQEYRELQHRGYDPVLGWEGNMQRQNQATGMAAPAAPGAMMR